MRDEEIARAVAAKLAPRFGSSLPEAVEQCIKSGNTARRERTRGLGGDALHLIADAAVIATFILAVVPLIRAKATESKNNLSAVNSAVEEAKRNAPPHISPEVIAAVATAVIDHLRSHPKT